MISILQRFWSKVSQTDGCWEWQGSKSEGYGKFSISNRPHWAHRVAYELEVGKIPEGHDLDHLCLNAACVRPDHLEAVSHAENLCRGMGFSGRHARATHCIRGHEFSAENMSVHIGKKTGRPWRSCLVCKRERRLAKKSLESSAT